MQYLRLKQENKYNYLKIAFEVVIDDGNSVVEVMANNHSQAAYFVRNSGYEVLSVNLKKES